MQSASASSRAGIFHRTREGLPGGALWTSALVFLLTLAIAKSTVTAEWVPGIEVVTMVALVGAVFMGLLAVLPIPWGAGVAIGMVAGPIAAAVASWPALNAGHPGDPSGLGLVSAWSPRVLDGSAIADSSFDLYLISWLMWVTGGWLAWSVLRWRRPLLGLLPGAADFATNLLNFPRDQNGYVLAVLVLTLALLLWTNYTSSIANEYRVSVKLTGDARWDFWESGLVAMAALIVLGIMLPPLSTAARTLDLESGGFSGWAQLQKRLSHPGICSTGRGTGVTGFTDEVKLSGPLQRTRDVVFTYTIVGNYVSKARYFRGVNDTLTVAGEWRYPGPNQIGLRQTLSKNEIPAYAEKYQKLEVAGINVTMLQPPRNFQDVLFYPGELYHIDRSTTANQVLLRPGRPGPSPNPGPNLNTSLYTIDRLSSLQPPTSARNYAATVEYSTATVADLQNAGTTYPAWLNQYRSFSPGYRPTEVENEIHNLALKIVNDAGATRPYDQATAIENYLRDRRNFTYTLTPPKTPEGRDPIEYFLFESKKGYCEYFATAMGDMLRSLGIPVRLVSGYGPGQQDQNLHNFVVRGEDAHTWVEAYFPAPSPDQQPYGWIPFEPTADDLGYYTTILRGQTGQNPCLRDDGCDSPILGITAPGGGATAGTGRGDRNDTGGPVASGGFKVGSLDASTLTRIVGVIVAALLLLLVVALRYLRPRTVMSVWKRTLALASLAGAERRPGETPLELGRRLQRAFPEAAEPVTALASGFVIAAYAPPEMASTSRSSIMEAWSALRPMLLRRVLSRLRPTRP